MKPTRKPAPQRSTPRATGTRTSGSAAPSRPAQAGSGAGPRSSARPAKGPGTATSRPEAPKAAAGRTGTGKPVPGKAVPGKAVPGKPVAGKPVPGKPTSGRPAQGKATSGKPAPRRQGGRPAAGRGESGERLQKLLAHAGVASRRACEELILEGHVQVNGVTVTELGTKADPFRDEITVDYAPIRKEAPVYLIMNKPKGYVTTVKDDEGRPTVMALLHGIPARVYPVGRLDFQSEGMLLLTNDGELAHHITSPDFHIPKVYLVKVHRTVPPETLDELRGGFRLDGRRLKPCLIEVMDKQGNPWLKVTLTEGKNQQIRRMFAAVGHPVHKLRRIQFGPITDPTLKPGEWRPLNPQELAALKAL